MSEVEEAKGGLGECGWGLGFQGMNTSYDELLYMGGTYTPECAPQPDPLLPGLACLLALEQAWLTISFLPALNAARRHGHTVLAMSIPAPAVSSALTMSVWPF